MANSAKAVGRKFLEEQDRLRGGPADELCTDDYAAYVASFPPMDLDGHKAFSSAFYKAFPDLRHHFEDLVAEGDRVAIRVRFTGTNTGPFMGAPPSGRPIDFPALILMRVESGRVAELHGQFDQAGVMQQIGAGATG